jgi:IS30 family transposase
MTYLGVTITERRLMRMWRQAGRVRREIARLPGRSPSTISREVAGHTGGCWYRPDFRQSGLRRLKRIAFGWSEHGTAKMTRIVIKRFLDKKGGMTTGRISCG